ncbi:MAG: transcription factor TFIIIB subunit brf1 [Thelocarpon impressellum]|nr:MAG: transcription factor TFIIIB subunit brf1 [Thelocarpon impressellum]
MSALRKPPHKMTHLKGVRNPPPIRRSAAKINNCPNPSCTDPKLEDIDDKRVCTSCGTVVSDSNIVSEVQFGETSSGAAVVQGSYVGADQSHARSMGTAFKRAGGVESREIAEANGKRTINQIAAALQITQPLADRAFQIYKLAVFYNFVQGRRIRNVAAVALYMTCRKEKNNSMMLIDFSDVLNVNVFKLGKTFKDFSVKCSIEGFEQVAAENLVHRLAARLEFGRKTEKVAIDAIRLVQRMEKDWMTTGRRPSGICGACLILAARMNNFRRTVREVVYVVKVTDTTINKRLEEFKVTPSSNLTVEEFRTIDLTRGHDPPAFYQQRQGKSKKRKRSAQEDDQVDLTTSRATSAVPTTEGGGSQDRASQQPAVRRDKDGFAIPEIPIDPTLLAASATALSELTSHPEAEGQEPPTKRQRGRPRKDGSVAPPPPSITTPADLAIEEALETEISQLLNDPSTQEHAEAYSNALTSARALSAANRPDAQIPDSSTISQAEFADDPEVANCVLTPEEQAVKERIWVHENREYLREQQRKLLKQATEERTGGARAKKRRNRKKRIGEGGEGSSASTPGEAVVNVMKRRGFSKKINYTAIRGLYDDRHERMSRQASVASESPSQGSGEKSPEVAPPDGEPTVDEEDDDGDEEDEDEVDDDVETAAEEEEDVEEASLDAIFGP